MKLERILTALERKKKRKAYMKAYMKTYYQRPEVKARRKAYWQRPEVEARIKAYRQRPDVKAHMKVHMKTYMKAYHQRPEVKAKKELRPLITEYHAILGKKKRTVREMRRLEALGDILGREIDEWRDEEQRKEYQGLME